MTHVSRSAAVAGAAVLALFVAGCGSDGGGSKGGDAKDDSFSKQSVKEIGQDAIAATKKLTSVRLSGTVSSDGEKMNLDLALDTDGACAGEIGFGTAKAQIIAVGKDQYMKANDEFWVKSSGDKSAASMNDMIGDKWVKLPAEAGDFSEFCDLDSFFEEIDDFDDETTGTKGGVSTIDGTEVLEISGKEDGGTTRLWIATGEPHYIVKVANDGKEPGQFTFSDFNEPVDAKKPADKDVMDMTG